MQLLLQCIPVSVLNNYSLVLSLKKGDVLDYLVGQMSTRHDGEGGKDQDSGGGGGSNVPRRIFIGIEAVD